MIMDIMFTCLIILSCFQHKVSAKRSHMKNHQCLLQPSRIDNSLFHASCVHRHVGRVICAFRHVSLGGD